ncbi:MAG TPA: DMP19 family protein [Usitatibacter sp.]|nr:DMP19 family protein [Usitatibacter sp.]
MPSIDDVLANEDPTTFAIALSDLVFARYDRDGFESLTPPERVAYCVDALEREVNNGGFEQFFTNNSGDTSAETVAALRKIGAIQAANLVQSAMELFPNGSLPRDREERVDVVGAMSDAHRSKWHELDDRFCSYPDDLTRLMRAFVNAHRAGFRAWP